MGDLNLVQGREPGFIEYPTQGEVMQVRVWVRGDVGPSDMWPYITGSRTLTSSRLLTLEVYDSRELVCVLVALADRGIEILTVDSLPERRENG